MARPLLSFVSRNEFIRSKLSSFSAHVSQTIRTPSGKLHTLAQITRRTFLLQRGCTVRTGAHKLDSVNAQFTVELFRLKNRIRLNYFNLNWFKYNIDVTWCPFTSRLNSTWPGEIVPIDPGYMSRKIRKFRTDKFGTWNKRKFWLMQLM